MRLDLDPSLMTPDERRRAIAELLAAGLRRLRDRAALGSVPSSENSSKHVGNTLEDVPDIALNVHAG